MTMMNMYWLTRCQSLNDILKVMSVILPLMYITTCIYRMDIGGIVGTWITKVKYHFAIFIVWFVFLVGLVLTPTNKELAAIIVVPKVVNNTSLNELPSNVVDLANAWIKDQIGKIEDEPSTSQHD